MGIWIKSQSQKSCNEEFTYVGLVECNWFALRRLADNYQIDGGINDPKDEDGGFLLGTYFTEAEAMQVLDMIQERIVHQEQVRLMPSQDWLTPSIVFQMPPAGFSQQPEKFYPDCRSDLKHCELLDGTKAGAKITLSARPHGNGGADDVRP